MTASWRFPRLRQWRTRSLANAFALQAALIAIASSLIVAGVSLAVIYWAERATLHERLQEKSIRLVERVEGAIGVIESAVSDLANSPVFVTALLDSRGRDIYVVPFLENYRFPIAARSGLALCDLNGQRLAGMRSPLSECRAESALFKQAIVPGKILRELVPLKDGHLAWTVYRGVVFPYTGTVEGVVVTQLDLYDVLLPLLSDLDVKSVALTRTDNHAALISATSGPLPPALESASARLFRGKPTAVPLSIEAETRDARSPFENKLRPLH